MRPALPSDLFGVVALCKRFHMASGVPFEFSAAHASVTAKAHIEALGHLCLVLEVDGALRGVLAASAQTSPLAPVLIAQELVFWVDPVHRGRAPRRMLKSYEIWARDEGCAMIGLSSLGDPRVARFYGAAGFALVENKFMKLVV